MWMLTDVIKARVVVTLKAQWSSYLSHCLVPCLKQLDFCLSNNYKQVKNYYSQFLLNQPTFLQLLQVRSVNEVSFKFWEMPKHVVGLLWVWCVYSEPTNSVKALMEYEKENNELQNKRRFTLPSLWCYKTIMFRWRQQWLFTGPHTAAYQQLTTNYWPTQEYTLHIEQLARQ